MTRGPGLACKHESQVWGIQEACVREGKEELELAIQRGGEEGM